MSWLLLLCLWIAPVQADDVAGPESPDGMTYQTQFAQELPAEVTDLLRPLSRAMAWQERPVVNQLVLHRRLGEDVVRFRNALQAMGWFGANVGFRLELPPEDQSGQPATAWFEIDPGPRYRFGAVQIDVQGGPGLAWTPERVGLVEGQPALSSAVLAAEKKVLAELAARGYPLARLQPRRAVADHDTRQLEIGLVVEAGPMVRLGTPQFTGASSVATDYLAQLASWQPGETYTPEALRRTRDTLFDTGLFSQAQVELAPDPDDRGRYPVQVQLAERKPRTLSLGGGYRSDLGWRLDAEWIHRNLWGAGERSRMAARLSQSGQQVQTMFHKPALLGTPYALIAEARVQTEERAAYEDLLLHLDTGLERSWPQRWKGRAGVGLEWSRVNDPGDALSRDFGLVMLPVTAEQDTTDHPMDPARGVRHDISVVPMMELLETVTPLVKVQGERSDYLVPWPDSRVVLASRLGVGTILGADQTGDVPDHQRFYAGGTGTIRGYKDQTAGPLDADGVPTGGRFLVHATGEVRHALTDVLGWAAFVDGGGVLDDPWPGGTGRLLAGAGVGARYQTPVGPLRLDLAIPLVRRAQVDESFQIYFSLGQAF